MNKFFEQKYFLPPRSKMIVIKIDFDSYHLQLSQSNRDMVTSNVLMIFINTLVDRYH